MGGRGGKGGGGGGPGRPGALFDESTGPAPEGPSAAAISAIEAFEARILSGKIERFGAFDKDGNQTVSLVGTSTHVAKTKEEWEKVWPKVNVANVDVHNHPVSGGSFSAGDISSFSRTRTTEMRAISRVSGRKILHRMRWALNQRRFVSLDELTQKWNKYAAEERSSIISRTTGGNARIIWENITHRVAVRLAKEYGFWYSREIK